MDNEEVRGSEEEEHSQLEAIHVRIEKLRKKHPWGYLWGVRFLEYIGLFLFVGIIGTFLFQRYNIVPTDIDNARYFLSAMAQAQAAIVSLVITLTLIAIQMTTASYTPRVVDVMKKNPDMWFLLVIYAEAMSIGFFALTMVAYPMDQQLVLRVLTLGIFSFSILFLYMWNTIALLRPDTVVKMLVSEINAENIHQDKWEDDIMQPVFDMVNASINRFDVTTTRTGLNELSKRLLELFSDFDIPSDRKDIAEYFCNHIHRSAIVAFKNEDEGIIREIIDVLQNFGVQCSDYKKWFNLIVPVDSTLVFIGTHAAVNGLENATRSVAQAFGSIGTRSAEIRDEGVTQRMTQSLKQVGIKAANNRMDDAVGEVAESLKAIGIQILEEGSGGAPDWLDRTPGWVAMALETIGIRAAENEQGRVVLWVAQAFVAVDGKAAEKGLDSAVGLLTKALITIGIRAMDLRLERRSTQVAQLVAYLLFKHKVAITEAIRKFESQPDPTIKDQTKIFLEHVKEELKKLETSKK